MNALEDLHVLAWTTADPPLPEAFDGQDAFVGYLLLDAWIGNSDRHHENWAIVQRHQGRLLSPSYDHASSLGRNEMLRKIESRLRGTDRRFTVETYASKCRSALHGTHEASRPMTTREAFASAAKRRPVAAEYWLSRLHVLEDDSVSGILDRIPDERCSELHRRFARRILEVNRHHLIALASNAHD
jgi:hypothetical protein